MINIVFADLSRCEDARQYVQHKLGAAFADLPERDLERLADTVCAADRSEPLPLVTGEALSQLTEAQQRSLARKKRLFAAAVERLSPLLEDETLEAEDSFAVLGHDAGAYPKGTPVLVRSTSQATIHYIFENVSVDLSTGAVSYGRTPMLAASPDALPDAERHVGSWMVANLPTAAGPSAEQVLGGLAKGLVGLLPGAYGKLGTALLGFLIPSGGGIDYKQLLDDIGTIIADANRRQTIATQCGILAGVVAYLHGNYQPQHDAGRSSKEELFALLNLPLQDVYKVIGILEQPEFEKGGISAFISAVTHKYLLYQEMALQDPSTEVPSESAKAKSIRLDAAGDVEHATRVLDGLQTEFDGYLSGWISKISPIKIRISDCPKSQWFFEDYHTGYHSPYFEQFGCKDDPHARAVAARASYIGTVTRKYRSTHQDQLPWMREAVDQWKKLIDQPLPPH